MRTDVRCDDQNWRHALRLSSRRVGFGQRILPTDVQWTDARKRRRPSDHRRHRRNDFIYSPKDFQLTSADVAYLMVAANFFQVI